MRLTTKHLAGLKFEGKQTKIFDDSLPNFGVRIYQAGVSFIVMLGKERRMKTIGRYPAMSLKEARTKAVTILNEIDPYMKAKSAESAIADFLNHSAQRNRPRTTKDYTRLLNRHFPKGRLQDISRSQLITRLDSLSNTPGEQSHASVTFNVFLNWCVNNGHLTENPIANIRKQGHVKQRNRILTDAELKQVFQHAQAVEKPFGTIVQLLILTGLRRGEVVALQPEWVGDAVITIPASHTKNGREHTLPFGNITEPLMRELPLTFNGWGKSKKRFDTALEIEPYTLHDLRRTFASNHARLGAPIHVVEKLLNHVSGSLAGVAGVYNRYNYLDEMTNACSQYEEWLQKLISGS